VGVVEINTQKYMLLLLNMSAHLLPRVSKHEFSKKWPELANTPKSIRRLLQPGIWLQSANPRLDHYHRLVDETGTPSAAFKAPWLVVKIINAENDDVGTGTKANAMAQTMWLL
jgi:hypothetical protein